MLHLVRYAANGKRPLDRAAELVATMDNSMPIARTVRRNFNGVTAAAQPSGGGGGGAAAAATWWHYGAVSHPGALLALLAHEQCLTGEETDQRAGAAQYTVRVLHEESADVRAARDTGALRAPSSDECSFHEIVVGPRRVFVDLETTDVHSVSTQQFHEAVDALCRALVQQVRVAVGGTCELAGDDNLTVACSLTDASLEGYKHSRHVVVRAKTGTPGGGGGGVREYMCATERDCMDTVLAALSTISDARVRAAAGRLCDFSVYTSMHLLRSVGSSKTGAPGAPARVLLPVGEPLTRAAVRHNLVSIALCDDTGKRASVCLFRPTALQQRTAVTTAVLQGVRLPEAHEARTFASLGDKTGLSGAGNSTDVARAVMRAMGGTGESPAKRARTDGPGDASAAAVAAAAFDVGGRAPAVAEREPGEASAETVSALRELMHDTSISDEMRMRSVVHLYVTQVALAEPYRGTPVRAHPVNGSLTVSLQDGCCPRAAADRGAAPLADHSHPWGHCVRSHAHNHVRLILSMQAGARVYVSCHSPKCAHLACPWYPLDGAFADAIRGLLRTYSGGGYGACVPFDELAAWMHTDLQ